MNKTILLPVLLALGACASSSVLEESRGYANLGQHRRAFLLLDGERERALVSGEIVGAELEKAWGEQRIEYLIERGRSLIFGEFDDEAMVVLAGVLALDPGNTEAERLREHAVRKKATRIVAVGEQLLAERQLEAALSAFIEAEKVLPTSQAALEGQWKVQEQVAKLTDRAQQQFLSALRKLPEFRYVEVRWHTSNALANDPTRADAEAVRMRARREIALETEARGQGNREAQQFGAALIEFRSAKDLDPKLPGIDQAITAMENEIEAGRLAEAARMHMRRMEFDEAQEKLAAAYDKSEMLRGGISELMLENRRKRCERNYVEARNLEYQGLKQDALAAFVALSAEWPEGLDDEKARIEALQSDITAAKKEWQLAVAAEKAGKLEDALEHYRASKQFYAKLHDAAERIARLQARMQANAGQNGS